MLVRTLRVVCLLVIATLVTTDGTAVPGASIETTYFDGCAGSLVVNGSRFQGCDGSRVEEGVLDGHWKHVWTESCFNGGPTSAAYEKCNGSWVYRGTTPLNYCPCS